MKCAIDQIFNLEIEITGGTMYEKPIKGLINEDINFKPKYYLQKFLKKILEEKESFIKAQQELFTKAGAIEKDGALVIEPSKLEDGSINPVIEDLNKQVNDLLNDEITFEGIQFKVDDFDFKSESVYPVFMSVAFE